MQTASTAVNTEADRQALATQAEAIEGAYNALRRHFRVELATLPHAGWIDGNCCYHDCICPLCRALASVADAAELCRRAAMRS